DGAFTFAFLPAEASIYAIRFLPGQQVVFIAAPGDTIRVSGDLSDFPASFLVEGNIETDLLQSFYSYSESNLRKVDSLQRLIDLNQGSADFYALTVRVDSLLNLIWEAQRQYEKAFLREHAGTLASLLVVNYHFGMKPLLSPEADRSDYRRVDSGLRAAYPNNRHTLLFHRWLQEVR
ncbi:MAG: hypothetical protein V1733_10125, partial [bacterium]